MKPASSPQNRGVESGVKRTRTLMWQNPLATWIARGLGGLGCEGYSVTV